MFWNCIYKENFYFNSKIPYILKQATSWNDLERARTSWNHLEQAGTSSNQLERTKLARKRLIAVSCGGSFQAKENVLQKECSVSVFRLVTVLRNLVRTQSKIYHKAVFQNSFRIFILVVNYFRKKARHR